MTNKTKLLTRDAILAVQDITTETVDVPEWGGAVLVRGMTGRERDAFESSIVQQPAANGRRQAPARQQSQTNMENLRAKLASYCIVDEKGDRLFSTEDVAALGGKNAGALSRVFDVAMRLSGITEGDVDELAEAMLERPSEGSSTP